MEKINGYQAIYELTNNMDFETIDAIKVGECTVRNVKKVYFSENIEDERYSGSDRVIFVCYTHDNPEVFEDYAKNKNWYRLVMKCDAIFSIYKKRSYRYELNTKDKEICIYPCESGGGRKPKLSEEQVAELLSKFKDGVSEEELIKEFEISKSTLRNTILGKQPN